MVRTRCCREGCANEAVQGGVCITHGAIVEHCSFEGCANGAKKGGVCRRHGAIDVPGREEFASHMALR